MGEVHATCRACGKDHSVDDSKPLPKSFPFCSERCALVDLSKWYDESFTVGRPIEEADLTGD